MAAGPIVFNNTVLRDGHQSLAATRMRLEQMLPALDDLDAVGFNYLETWGGATIDVCLRFLDENPFDRLRVLKSRTSTPHMMLLRGQNIVQYSSFPDDVVELFVKCSAAAGVDVFRVFDALNDTRNLVTPIRAVKAAGKHAQGVICYTTSPVHTTESLAAVAKDLVDMECDSICIKDMAGLITPPAAAELITILKRNTDLPITLHTHSTAGLGHTAYYAAVEAGADFIDTSIVPFANGTGQPDTLLMQHMLGGHPRCPSYDTELLGRLQDHFTKVYAELAAFTSPSNERVDADIIRYQVSGGMMSNFLTQLKEQNMADRMDDVMQEVMYVRECLGWVPLVTPTSQIVGTQAMLNVKFGRWKNLAQQTIDVALGRFGRTPGPIDPELLAQVVAKAKQDPVTERPADLLAPRVDDLRAKLGELGLPADDETVVLYAMFPQQVEAYYRKKAEPEPPAPEPAPEPSFAGEDAVGERRLAVTVNAHRYEVTVEELA